MSITREAQSHRSAPPAPVEVEFVRGADVTAPGLSRAQEPLVTALRDSGRCRVTEERFPSARGALLFPYLYGPLAVRLALSRADVVHLASSWYAHLVPLISQPTVVTCYDLIGVPGAVQAAGIRRHRRFHVQAAFRGLGRADAVVCISNQVARELLSLAPGLSGRVSVIYLGIDAQFFPAPVSIPGLHRLGVRPPYALYVGSEQPRKNLARLVTAVSLARRRLPQLQLVKVGVSQTDGGRLEFNRAVREADMEPHTVILDNVGDNDLVNLYRGAHATMLVSLREGFGFPPLEAMACGCPAIVSSVDPLLELAGDAALVVNPLDTDSIADAIVRLSADQSLRPRLVERGLARSREFSWTRAAAEYGDVYERVARWA